MNDIVGESTGKKKYDRPQRNYTLVYTLYVHREPECMSLRQIWVPSPPTPPASVTPPLDPRGEGKQHSLAGEGVGRPNSDDWKESLALCESVYSVVETDRLCQEI